MRVSAYLVASLTDVVEDNLIFQEPCGRIEADGAAYQRGGRWVVCVVARSVARSPFMMFCKA
jgi:hypothetical protein